MSIVNLVSGGLDSTLISIMIRDEGVRSYPLFIDYGQRASDREWQTCQNLHKKYDLPTPTKMDLTGFGRVIASGLTRLDLDVKNEAFTPGRNLLFLLMASAHAYQVGASQVAIGLLSEKFSLFPDQRSDFISKAESAIASAMGTPISVLTPLFDFGKADVIKLAAGKGLIGTYSCHSGGDSPCGVCISCLEFKTT